MVDSIAQITKDNRPRQLKYTEFIDKYNTPNGPKHNPIRYIEGGDGAFEIRYLNQKKWRHNGILLPNINSGEQSMMSSQDNVSDQSEDNTESDGDDIMGKEEPKFSDNLF